MERQEIEIFRERNELLKTVKRLGRTLWKKWSGYHRKSLMKTRMDCNKLLGELYLKLIAFRVALSF